MNRLDLAEQFLKRAVAFAATNATMYDHLGDLYYKTGRYHGSSGLLDQGSAVRGRPGGSRPNPPKARTGQGSGLNSLTFLELFVSPPLSLTRDTLAVSDE